MAPAAGGRGPPLRRPPAVARVLAKVVSAARQHGMFLPGGAAIVAVSGGPDSLCLLHSLVRLRRLLQVEPVCFHFDHRLRPGSERDAAYVRSQASRLDVPFILRTALSRPAKGESVEAWARTVRYEALAAVVEQSGGGTAVLGHTADDQAETVLIALFRGGGLQALSGMAAVSPPVVRPLLQVTREETLSFCRALRLHPRSDPMNEEPRYLRVGIRKEVIPLLEEAIGREIRPTLVRTASLLREDAELLRDLALEASAGIVERSAEGTRLFARSLRELQRPLATRVVRAALLDLGVVPETSHVDAVLALASARPGRRSDLPGGLLARRERGYVRVSRPSPGL